MLPIEDVFSLPLLYHLNSEPWAHADPDSLVYEIPREQFPVGENATALPVPTQESALLRILRSRRSCRLYTRKTMTSFELGTLLGGACGVTGSLQLAPGVESLLRASPSAGGLFPLEFYLVTQEVERLGHGLHRYNVLDHSIEKLPTKSGMNEIAACLLEPKSVENANVVVLIAARFERPLKKYGPRGYRYILLEAGHVAQNICLLATAQGLGSLCIGGFVDSRLNRVLSLDCAIEGVIYCVAIGHPEDSKLST